MDVCEIRGGLPELNITTPFAVNTTTPFCHIDSNFLTQVKFVGSYTVAQNRRPVFRDVSEPPGPQVTASRVTAELGDPTVAWPSACRRAQNATINIVSPGDNAANG